MTSTPTAGPRVRLPYRRRSETRKVSWRSPNNVDGPETKIHVTIGYADDGLRPVEIFYDAGYRTGSVGFASVFGVLLDQLNTPPAWAEEVSKHTGAS